MSLTRPFNKERFIETEVSLNTWGSASFKNFNDLATDGQLKFYRAYGRYSSPHFEARIGLQKICFGSATLLRPLMWFDRLDPRDPLQITAGVYALLLRYYFFNNTNLWLWGLYGNKEAKGWELWPTAKGKPEFGGRGQIPLGRGELGLSFHHRLVSYNEKNVDSGNLVSLPSSHFGANASQRPIPEDRFGVDGKWDLGLGFWFEVTFIRQKDEFLEIDRQWSFVVGSDYTFNVGHGFHLLAEYFEMTSGKNSGQRMKRAQFLAISLSYPLSLLDSLATIVFHDSQKGDTYFFFRWQRTYDRWNFHLMAFWNPKPFKIYYMQDQTGRYFAGRGLQMMVVFHY